MLLPLLYWRSIFLIVFEYRIAVSALTAIFHDLIMVLGVFSFFQLEIDASFLAAILTVVGYSMNESVVIFDRVRENAHTHKRTDTFEDLANASIAQSIHRSIYTLATVMFACVSLFVFGGDTTKNFALCMILVSPVVHTPPSVSLHLYGCSGKIEIRTTFAINNLIVMVKAINLIAFYCDWGFSYE